MLAIADQRVSNPHIFVEITYKRAGQGAGTQALPPANVLGWTARCQNPNPRSCIWTRPTCPPPRENKSNCRGHFGRMGHGRPSFSRAGL